MSRSTPKYVIVSPVRDEADYIEQTIRGVVNQTITPAEWVLVDDGSRDRTGQIADAYAQEHDWIQVVHRGDRGYRAAGSGVMEAFYAGYDSLRVTDWDYLVKLDGDLTIEEDYFERCLAAFDGPGRLGISGGVIYNRIDGELELERHPSFHVRGATKIYSRACWDDIGGLYRIPGWDTLDEVKASMLGWETRSLQDVHLIQERFTGDAAGQWSNWVKNGRASYKSGYHPLFLVVKAFARARRKPYLTASVGLLKGFFGAMLARDEQIDDRDLIRYLRDQQLRRLTGRSSVWR